MAGIESIRHIRKTVQRFNSDPEKVNSISADQVISLYLDDDILWIGTFGGGLNKLDIRSGVIQNITEAEGLPNNVVFAILPDDDGNLWISSSKGLTRFNPQTFSFINYTDTDGVQGNDFWWGSVYKDQLGRLYFGGTSGLTILDPTQISVNEFNAPIVISSIYIDGYQVPLPSRKQQLLIQPEQNTITLEFAALDFQSPEKNQYAYKLDGLHRDWTYAGGRSQVNFASLPPGHYTFRVRGTNSDGVWSTEVASLNIYVVPRFYQTAWFYFLVAVTLVIGIVLGVRYWTRLSRMRQIELEELVAERTQILELKKDELLNSYAELRGQTIKLTEKNAEVAKQNAVILAKSKELESINKQLISLNEEKNSLIGIVAHDLRSPAASIMSCVQLLQLQPELERAEQEELFDTIRQFVEKQLFMVTRILDSQSLETGALIVNPTTVHVETLLKTTQNNLMEKARTKCISIKLSLPDHLCPLQTDLDILDQILDNLISNAIKFSPRNTTITLIAEQSEKAVKIGVIDQGPGLTEADKAKLFGKYQRLSAKPTDGEQSTGLGLSIVKRLTQVLGGEVWCESTYGEGAAFWVSIPLKSEKLSRREFNA